MAWSRFWLTRSDTAAARSRRYVTGGHWGPRSQVDATTLLTPQARGQRARQLVAEGLADILAGDNHGDERTVATGARFLRAQDGADQVELLVGRTRPRSSPTASSRRFRRSASGRAGCAESRSFWRGHSEPHQHRCKVWKLWRRRPQPRRP